MEERHVGRYALVKLIGRGGMADVWIGKAFGASGFEKIVAIKLLAPDNVDKEEYQRALTDEARILVNLKHPNIVDVYDLNFEAENPYLVMEYVEGTELREILRACRDQGKKIPISVAAYIVGEVSKALSHAHERLDPQTGEPLHIVHRDISPSNILISTQGDVKLSDFGIAKSSLQSAKTQIGLIKGKFRYMSPEQAEGRLLDARADLFSLGLVLFECLEGKPAYDESSDLAILQRARYGDVRLPGSFDSDLLKIFKKVLAPKHQDRYSNLIHFRKEFSDWVVRQGAMADRDDLVKFLSELDLPLLKKSIHARRQAEEWNPQPTTQVLTGFGTIETLTDTVSNSRRRRLLATGGVSLLILITVFLLTSRSFFKKEEKPLATQKGSLPSTSVVTETPEAQPTQAILEVSAVPEDSLIQIKYGRQMMVRPSPIRLEDIPFAIPVDVTVTKKGFRTETKRLTFSTEKSSEKLILQLQPVQSISVRFVADPYAEVSVPGFLSHLETPTGVKTLPAGDYEVVFVHAPSGKRAVASLRAKEGGSFLCSARMDVSDSKSQALASCRSR